MKQFDRLKWNVLALLVLMAFGMKTQAQQEPQYSQYMFNQLSYNPAYAGSRDALSATMILRRQWLGFDGGPVTGNVNAHMPILNEKHGVGFNFSSDHLGLTNQTNFTLNYAYRIAVRKGFFQAGLSGGILYYKTKFSQLVTTQIDPNIPSDAATLRPRAGLGLYYYNPKFYVGVSTPNIINGKYYSHNSVAGNLESKQSLHAFAMMGAILPLGKAVSLRPSAVVKYAAHSPLQVDANLTIFFAKTIGVGVGYRTTDALVFMLEYTSPRRFRMGYAYDMTLSPLKTTNSGSHELMIGLDIGWGKSNFLTPRYF
jgi:type IX secretion system PorP/SprF family membrane protein